MLRSILVGLDGSQHGTNAVDLGVRWAARFDALLVGLGVIDEPTIRRPEMVPIGASTFKQKSDEARLARARTCVEQTLERFALRCTATGVAHKVLENVGLPHEQILLEAQRFDLILLGQQTHFQFATQEYPDDTLTRVLRNTPRPVVAVPEQYLPGTGVLVAYDGSLQAARALQAFQASGLASGEEVHVLTVGADHVEACRHADRAVEFLAFHDVKASRHVVVPSPTPAQTILEQTRRLRAGLVVMGCYGQPTLREFFLGSVTRNVLDRSPVPLFLYH